MNRRQLAVVALAVAFGLTGCLASGPSGGTATDAPAETTADVPSDTATAISTAPSTATPTGTAAPTPSETPTATPAESAETTDDGTGTTIDYEGDAVTVRSDTGQVIRGTTDRQPGTEITVRLSSQGSTPFLKQRETTVRDDGSFEASFDFSDIEPGTAFSVTVSHDGEDLASAPGEVTGS